MIYVLTLTKIAPGEPTGMISDLFENAFLDSGKADKAFDSMPLSREYIRKELWTIDSPGKRRLIKEERFAA